MSILVGYSTIYQHVDPIRYALDEPRDLIIEEWRGHITAKTLQTHWPKFLAHEEVMRCRRTVVDISESYIDLKTQDFNDLVQSLVAPALNGKKWMTAIIVKSSYQHGLSRQYSAFADTYSRDQIFSSPAEAFEWIADKHHLTASQRQRETASGRKDRA